MNKKHLWFLPIIIVCVGIILGIYFAGSPRTARSLRMDERRIQDLGSLQATVDAYWRAEKKLPESLNEVMNAGQELPVYSSVNYYVPTDPITQQPYEYKRIDEDTFEVCANFEMKKDYGASQPYYGPYGQGTVNWSHEAGYKCFTSTVSTSTLPY